MRRHVVHLAVVAGLQPALQVRFVLAQLDVADTDLLEPQLAAPVLDGLGEAGGVRRERLSARGWGVMEATKTRESEMG